MVTPIAKVAIHSFLSIPKPSLDLELSVSTMQITPACLSSESPFFSSKPDRPNAVSGIEYTELNRPHPATESLCGTLDRKPYRELLSRVLALQRLVTAKARRPSPS